MGKWGSGAAALKPQRQGCILRPSQVLSNFAVANHQPKLRFITCGWTRAGTLAQVQTQHSLMVRQRHRDWSFSFCSRRKKVITQVVLDAWCLPTRIDSVGFSDKTSPGMSGLVPRIGRPRSLDERACP